MAIIRPSKTFEGSDLGAASISSPYFDHSVRRAVFSKKVNPDGAYLYFLPAYKLDAKGNGVWYKTITIRDQFGDRFREKYYVADREKDPASYFEKNFRILYPEDAKVVDEEVNGRTFKRYPNYGRTTQRVLFNVAFAKSLSEGTHVLDLPLKNGADHLDKWLRGKTIEGEDRKPFNDPDECYPVMVQMTEGQNPWSIVVDTQKARKLPPQLADTDYLYNLDDIMIIKPNEEIVQKLRDMYSSEIFDDCMDGFPGLTKSPVAGHRVEKRTAMPVAKIPTKPSEDSVSPVSIKTKAPTKPIFEEEDDDIDMTPPTPAPEEEEVLDIPKVKKTNRVEEDADEFAALPANPMKKGALSKKQVMDLLSSDEEED